MELWDAYDEGLNKIDGSVLVRGEQIPNECFHLVSFYEIVALFRVHSLR